MIRPNAYLPQALVALLGSVRHNEPAAQIAQRCEEIAQIYRERPSPNQMWDTHRQEIVTLLTQEAERFWCKANSDTPHTSNRSDGHLHHVS